MKANADYKLYELNGLPSSFFERNRSNFLSNLKSKLTGLEEDSILFLKGGEEQFRYDNDDDMHYFMQESNFYYLTGVKELGFYATIDIRDGEVTLFVPVPDETTKIFFHIESLEDISAKYGARAVELPTMASDIAKRNPKKIYVLNGTNSDSGRTVLTCDFVFPPPHAEFNNVIDNDGLIYEILADTRTVKSEDEIALMRELNAKTVEGHVQVMKSINKCKIERDIENVFWDYMIHSTYCRNHPYDHVCGCGPNGATLHYTKNDGALAPGQLVLMDMGAKSCGYCSDITSTIPVNGKFTDKQKQVYNVVLNANKAVMNAVKPGVNWVDMHLLAERTIIEGLQRIGVLNQFDVEEMVSKRVCYYFMPHGVGHLLGLDVHDVGGYLSFTPERSNELGLKSLRSARYLSVNTVMTIEPGVYFIPFLLEKAFKDAKIAKYFNESKIKEYYDVGGVRIEDNIVVTTDGCENLTQGLPRTVEEIEKVMAGTS